MSRLKAVSRVSLSLAIFLCFTVMSRAAGLGMEYSVCNLSSNAEPMQPGKFEPTWESLKQYQCPQWFKDAKFGIWAHWSAQCVPGDGDWYARKMYIQGSPQYDFHVAHYGHPSKFGFMEIDHLWRA